jgi:hypothetical protein
MSFIDRISNGWKLTMNSFKILKENKKLILFPILSGISLLFIMGSFILAVFASAGWDLDNVKQPNATTNYVFMFLFYLVNYFVVVFFNMALIHCTRLYFQGEEPTIRKGIQFSLTRIGSIFAWAVFAATVGTILRAIQERAGLLGKIITGLLGLVWSIATFFVVPVIAYENLGPIAAFKRSTQIMKEKWGESLTATFSFGLIHFIAIIIVGLPLFLLGLTIHPILGGAMAIMGMFLVYAILSAAQTIFISAVYHNINDEPVLHFQKEMLDNLFKEK